MPNIIVAPSGGDYTTINAALAAASNGDTILVRSGTYAEIQNGVGIIDIGISVTIKGYPGDTPPTVTYGTQANAPMIHINSNLTVVLYGLNIVGQLAYANDPQGSFDTIFPETNVDLTIDHCTITGWADTGIMIARKIKNLLVQYTEIGAGGLDQHNHCLYIADDSIVPKLVRYNNMHHATGFAIHAYTAAQNVTAYGNILHHNAWTGILLTGGGHFIYYNTIADNGASGVDIDSITNLDLRNNIMWNNALSQAGYDIRDSASYSGGTFGHNLYLTTWQGGAAGPGDLHSNPEFLGNTIWSDYKLTCGAPAKSLGTVIANILGLDPAYLVLTPKPATGSIGAFQY